MGGLVFAGVAPHGFTLIPAISEDAGGALQTRRAMEELDRRCAAGAEILSYGAPGSFGMIVAAFMPAAG